MPADKVGGQLWQSLKMTISPAVFDRNVPALDEAQFTQASLKCRRDRARQRAGRPEVKVADHRRDRLLRTNRKGPCRCQASQRHQLASFQLMELHPLPLTRERKHSGLARIRSGACCDAGFQPGLGPLWVKT